MLALGSVICVLTCCGVLDLVGKANDRQDRRAARAALGGYLTRVEDGDYLAAYQQLCSDVLEDYPETEHVAFLRQQRAFVSYAIGDPTESSGIDGTYLAFPVSLTYVDGSADEIGLVVGLQTDGPKVCDSESWRSGS
ncbi:hypothetical protein GA0070624_4643 [Micromonospora rhizosphaerae]|uniref:Uncharacterized protein n=1 Tax=Micromonospora rhizosphaerae TaxID=568872 RepID=A0A1C6SUD6_9ACTN|nr:hypothetical protein GA0070624_4643 [Micromonospora rhizosphaerae]